MTIAPQQVTRVRCRPIADSDLDRLADLLTRGFPQSHRSYWREGFARWQHVPVVEGLPRYGYVLDGGIGPVGVILLISSQRGDRVIANLSSWYVEPQWRTHSTLLIAVATKLKHVTYLNASPAPHTWRTLQAQGFVPYNFGRSAVFALPGRGAVRENIPDDLPEAQLLRDHRAMGQISLTVEKDGIVSPFVLKPRRLDKPPVPVMDVMFTRSPDDLRRCAPALARHFLPRGSLGFLIDGDMEGLLSHYVEGKEPRYFKGPHRPVLGDLAYTEKVIFG
ncbi:MAG TPA: hypothetical protein VHZ32_09280 [Rhizomicrobium sp.]|nr:hypothetical protein [Rhizomicrobium sp.]